MPTPLPHAQPSAVALQSTIRRGGQDEEVHPAATAFSVDGPTLWLGPLQLPTNEYWCLILEPSTHSSSRGACARIMCIARSCGTTLRPSRFAGMRRGG